MTAIAVKIYEDEIVMACDSMVSDTEFGIRNDSTKKIFKHKNVLIGACGDSVYIWLFINNLNELKTPLSIKTITKWVQKVMNKLSSGQYPGLKNINSQDACSFILAGNNKVFEVEGYDISEITDYTAIGAGWAHSITALDMGADPEEAVEMACKRSTLCGPPTHSERLTLKKKGASSVRRKKRVVKKGSKQNNPTGKTV